MTCPDCGSTDYYDTHTTYGWRCNSCGEYTTTDMTKPVCCICGGPMLFWGLDPESPYGYGNNPDPVCTGEEDRCCGTCNDTKVIPARLRRIVQGHGVVIQEGDE